MDTLPDSESSTHKSKVLDLDTLGIDVFNTDRNEIDKVAGIQRMLKDRDFKIPQGVAGFVRMVGEVEYDSAMNPNQYSMPASEYFIVKSGTPREVVPKRVLDASDDPTDTYNHVIYIPRERFEEFDVTMRFHNNFDSNDYPAVIIKPHTNFGEYTQEKLKPEDWTERLKPVEGD
jgi:hypothetical protein